MLRINWYEKVLGNQKSKDGRRLWGRVVQNTVSIKQATCEENGTGAQRVWI